MKIILFLLILISMIWTQPAPQTGTLVVRLKGMENDNGLVMVALCNSEANFSDSDSAFRGVQSTIVGGKAQLLFTDIPFGEYAVKVYHDENEDGELDSNFFGKPTEEFGFSNNVRGLFGPPSWDQARFVFKSELDSIFIDLK